MNIWMTALMTFILSVGGVAARAADFKAGFGGLEWSADVKEHPQLQFLYEKENVAFYTDPDRVYTVNDISVGPVIYGFQKGKFFAAY
ncbi:MAG: hypothetical protein MUP74_01700, partial [Desulfobacterales bacterium]|nr:hypothetical protein [Desulfobacterales bacterium]